MVSMDRGTDQGGVRLWTWTKGWDKENECK